MIVKREVTYGWLSTEHNSRSIRYVNDVQTDVNYVQNPSAEGDTSSLTPEGNGGAVYTIDDTQTGPGDSSYRVAVGTSNGPQGAITSPAPASAGQRWWFRTTARLDPNDFGAREMSPVLRFYDSNGTLLQSTAGDSALLVPRGTFHRWTGTPGSSPSEEYTDSNYRLNDLINPAFANGTDGWAVGDGFDMEAEGGLSSTATQDQDDGAFVAYYGARINVTEGEFKSAIVTATAEGMGNQTDPDDPESADDTIDSPAQSLRLAFRFYDDQDVALDGQDFYGIAADVTTDPTTLVLNGAQVPPGATAARLGILVVDSMTTGTVTTIQTALSETGVTVGNYFDGDTANTGTGNVPDTFDVWATEVAPPTTATVRASVLRVLAQGWEPDSDVFYLDSLLLTPNEALSVPGYFDGNFPTETTYINDPTTGELTTDEYLEIDDVPLNTYAYNIQSSGGNRLSPPGFRGSNWVVPGRPGTVFKRKELDAQNVTLSMWVQGSETDGSRSEDAQQQFKHNFKMLRKLLFRVNRELKITKRWVDYETGEVRSATGKAQFNGGLEPSMTGAARALFSVDFVMNDPFFYDDKKTITGQNFTKKTWTVDVEGDWRTTAITARVAGPRKDPRITVVDDEGNKTWVKFTGTINSGDTLVLDVNNFSAVMTRANGTTFSVIGNITHGGDRSWLALGTDLNSVTFESASGTGPVSLDYLPVWF